MLLSESGGQGTESNRRHQPFQGCELFFKGFALALGLDETILARAHLSAARIMIDLNLWWPGTESNRRRQPFQGCELFFKGFTLALGADATILARAHLSAARIMIDLNLWWPGTESNRRRQPFQGCALPTELPGHYCWGTHEKSSVGPVEDFVRTERD
jgi:hypothetical protein